MRPDALHVHGDVAWLVEDSLAAEREGWNVFDTTGASLHPPLEIERVDEDAVFVDDDEAFQFVVDEALKGRRHAIKALAICYAAMLEDLDARATNRSQFLEDA